MKRVNACARWAAIAGLAVTALAGATSAGDSRAAAATKGAASAPSAKHASAKPRASARKSYLSPLAQASEARAFEELGAYGQAAEALRELRRWVPPDADLELALALDEARTGHLDSARVRLRSPIMTAALVDTLPLSRRHFYPWRREDEWIDGRYDGWSWYIARARAEVAASLGEWTEAFEAAQLAALARPLAGKEWLVLSVCASHAGNAALAEGAARRAAFLDPSLPEAQYLNGLYAWRAGRRSAAQASFRQAVWLDSTYEAPGLALMHSRLAGLPADTLPTTFLTGLRQIGLLCSPMRPKLEEFAQMDTAARLIQLIQPPLPDSLRGVGAGGKFTIPLLVDEQGHVILHELPWFEFGRVPEAVVSLSTGSFPGWRFEPGHRLGHTSILWTAVQLTF